MIDDITNPTAGKLHSTSEFPRKVSILVIPKHPANRPSKQQKEKFEAELVEFCSWIKKLDARLDFKVSARGFGYIMENENLITKDEFDLIESVINDARKSGHLPIDICAYDQRRLADGIEDIHEEDHEDHAGSLIEDLKDAAAQYTPFSFWEDQDFYLETMVEKIDLKSLFSQISLEYYIPITNAAGWNDINSRALMMERFQYWENKGKQCVLLYMGDFDPAGLMISDYIKSNLNDLSGAVGWHPRNLKVDRFGLSFEFIEEFGLTWIPNLKTSAGKYPLNDPRHKDHKKPYVQNYLKKYGVRKVEANALVVRPEEGRQLYLDTINRYIPGDAPAAYRAAIKPERDRMTEIINAKIISDEE